jgi:hypothetical protein
LAEAHILQHHPEVEVVKAVVVERALMFARKGK